MTTKEEKSALAASYASITQSDAWKDLENFLNREREASLQRIERKSAADLTIGEVCQEVGMRKAMLNVLVHISNRLSGL